jgi:CRISPR-associated protein Cmr2
MNADRWKKKIAAYLAWPPDRAIAPERAEARAADLVEAALGEPVDLPIGAARQAAGLDVPLGPGGSNAARTFLEDPKTVHPLSGEAHSLDLGDDLDQDAVSAAVEDAVATLRDEVLRNSEGGGKNGPASETLFLTLWRKLPRTLRSSGTLPEGAWDLMPADPRFPSLSTWHHASAASALAGAGESPALLLFTLGSPQAFVTTSRRTQDYWMGSFLVSYLIWQGMQALADRCGPDAFLYPNLHGQPLVDRWLESKGVSTSKVEPEALQIANFPNVFTALVPYEEAEGIAKDVEQAIREAWDRIGRGVKQEVEGSVSEALGLELAGTDVVWSEDWSQQLEDFPDRLGVFWAACSWGEPGEVLSEAFPKGGENHPPVTDHVRTLVEWVKNQDSDPNAGMSYALLSNLAGGALTSRKALRDVPQRKEPGWKCSLCGERRALRPEWDSARERYGHRRDEVLRRLFWEDLGTVGREEDNTDYQKLAGHIRPGDRLCAVCLTKRLALNAHFSDELDFDDRLLFPSTATVATVPFKAALLNALDVEGDLADTIAHYTEATYAFLKEAGAFYPSAAVPKLEALAEDVAHGKSGDLLRLDGGWLYEEAFDPDKLRREYEIDIADHPKLNELRLNALESLRALLDNAQELGAPSRYYAILSMDGDKMGNRIQGKNAPFYEWMLHPKVDLDDLNVPTHNSDEQRLERPTGPGTHLALSGVLKDFALRLARFAVEKANRGKLIFAGGDDAIALVPVADLLPTMRLLRTFFQGRDMAEPKTAGGVTVQTDGGFGQIANENDDAVERLLLGGPPHERGLRMKPSPEPFQGPTASIGVAIVHESAPLVPSIEEAKKAMEESAKEETGRDAFAVHLLKRSGAPIHASAPFFPGVPGNSEEHDVLSLVDRLVDLLREERLTPRLARNLLDRPLGRDDITLEDLSGWLREARRAELHRLTRRTSAPEDNAPIETLDTLLQALHKAEKEMLEEGRESVPSAWTTLAHLIRLADFMVSETAHAD